MSELHAISDACTDPARKADVVFVHGLMGDPFKTWRHGETEDTSWPHWVMEEFPKIGVWTLGYPAALSKWPHWLRALGGLFIQLQRSQTRSGHATPLERRAGTTLDRLVQKGLGRKPLIFVCHSLGGLLVKQLIHTAAMSREPREKALASSISDVLFLATPHHGADLATLARHLRSLLRASVIVDDLQAHGAHLESLAEYYKAHAGDFGIQTHAYYETIGIAGSDMLVVNSTSANPGIGRRPDGLDRDHGSICKPLQQDDPVCERLREILQGLPARMQPPASVASLVELMPRTMDRAFVRKVAVHVHLPADQPQAARLSVTPCQLPRAASKFFGRNKEVKALVTRLGSERNTVVAGAAGLGKTALAAEALHRMLGERPRERLAETPFPDGIVYLDLYQQKDQPQAAWREIADALGGRDLPQNTTDDLRAREACRGKQLLLIVEGGEEADGGLRADGSQRPTRHSLIDPLQWEGSVLWLTRPTPTSPVAQITLDAPLSEGEADALLVHLTTGAPLPVEPAVRRALAEGLGRHPLALTWAGGLLQRGGLRPQQLIEELHQQPTRVLHDPEDTRHTLQWLFQRSVRLLDTNAHDTLAAAGLLAHAPFPLSALCAATELAPDAQQAAIRQCVQSRLLEWEAEAQSERWHFGHALGHRFAAALAGGLEPERRDAMLQRLMQWTDRQLQAELAANAPAESLAHVQTLLQACRPPSGWDELVCNLLYVHEEKLDALGRLGERWAVLDMVEVWWQRIADAQKNDVDWQRVAGAIHNLQGSVLTERGDLSGAQRRYEIALEIIKALVARNSENDELQRELGVSQTNLGQVLLAQGDLAGARQCYEVDLRISEELASRYPGQSHWQRDLSVSLDRIGDVLQKQGDLALAQQRYESSLHICEALAERDQENAGLKRDISVSYNKLGDVMQAQGDLVKAQRHYEAAHQIIKAVVASNPDRTGWKRDLSVSFERLGNTLRMKGDPVGSQQHYEDALRIREELAECAPENAGWQRDLMVILFKLGGACGAQGDTAGQRARWTRAQTIVQALVQRWPEHPEFRKDLAMLDGAVASLDG